MATTGAGSPYVMGTDNITTYPTTSLALANRVDAVESGAAAALTSGLAAKTDTAMTQNAQTGSSYSYALADASKLLSMSNASANTVLVTKQATVTWVTGTQLRVMNLGAGLTTLVADTGVTINGNKALGQYQGGTLIRTASDVWLFVPTVGVPTSATATVATSQNTSSVTYTDLATAGPAVTLVTGTKALVIFTCNLVQGSNNGYAYASFAISGATTQAASDVYSLMAGPATAGVQGPTIRASTAQIFTGLTAGSNTFTVKYRTNINVSYFQDRNITVIDMGS